MGAPLSVNQRMEFIYDDGFGGTQHILSCLAGQHQVKRLRGDNQNMGRLFHHLLPLPGGGIPGADGNGEQFLTADSLQGLSQIFPDIRRQGF